MKNKIIFLSAFLFFRFSCCAQIDSYYTDIGYFQKTELSITLFNAGRHLEAFQTLDKAIEEGTNPAYARTIKGLMFLQIGHTEDGLKCLKKANKEAPAYLAPVDILSWYEMSRGDFEAALKIVTRAIYANPLQKEAYLLRAMVKLKMSYADFKSDGGAQEDFDYAMQLSKDSAECYYEISLMYMRLSEYRKVLEICDKLLLVDSTHDKGFVLRGNAYRYLGWIYEKRYCEDYYKSHQLGNKEGTNYLKYYCRSYPGKE